MKRGKDAITADMFSLPAEPVALPGSMDHGLAIRRLLSDIIKECPLNSRNIADAMSDLTCQEITEHQLHAWTAPSRENWRFPLEYLPAFEAVCETHRLSAYMAEMRGARLLIGRDALNAEIGRLERLRDDASKKIKRLKKMGESS